MDQVAIVLGANQKSPLRVIEAAIRLIEWNLGCVILSSSNYKTPAWGYESNNPYLNKVVIVETDKEPKIAMGILLQIEKILGRKRNSIVGYADRMIDLDILFFGQLILKTEHLQVPHPRMQDRNFCLVPLSEIAPAWKHPILNKNSVELLNDCEDDGFIELWKEE